MVDKALLNVATLAVLTLMPPSPAGAASAAKLDMGDVSRFAYRGTLGCTTSLSTYREKRRQAEVEITAEDAVLELKDGGLPVSVIAEILNVERKTVYSWMRGGRVSDSNLSRIKKIHYLLTAGKSASFKNLYRYWNVQLKNNLSLSALLTAKEIDESAAKTALDTVWPMARKAEGREGEGKQGRMVRNPLINTVGDATFDETLT